MSDISEDDNEISFSLKFLGRVKVGRPGGLQTLDDANQDLKKPQNHNLEKAAKKSKVHFFLTMSGIDILENKTKFLVYSCPLTSISFCAVIPTSPKVFGFVAQNPAADTYYCYLFQSTKFSHVLVSLIGDACRASKTEKNTRGNRDLKVEALRHKNKLLQRENEELKRKLLQQTDA
ncbi:PTB domain-containing engulfment adapter protein 1-like [Labrus mixtus]|uniref:PTB domain-containing engulfment adapter protein 1-like n=1 Tax=Labrus mixtus TaxID=508554 RepID=UPI0029C00C82|nr:PTB domain-containing engulfment adapter protein 1-like [Labrus mixtus]